MNTFWWKIVYSLYTRFVHSCFQLWCLDVCFNKPLDKIPPKWIIVSFEWELYLSTNTKTNKKTANVLCGLDYGRVRCSNILFKAFGGLLRVLSKMVFTVFSANFQLYNLKMWHSTFTFLKQHPSSWATNVIFFLEKYYDLYST